MSFYEFIQLFEERRRTFLMVLGVVLFGAVLVFQFQKPCYRTELLLTVTRTSVQSLPEYGYDHFYRFQADERMAESLVQYLSSETGKRDVAEQAKLAEDAFRNYTTSKLKAVRLGTNIVKIEFTTPERGVAGQVSEALSSMANQYLFNLNEDARQKEWFTVVDTVPVTQSKQWSLAYVMITGLAAGVFLGFWSVLLQYTWQTYKKHKASTTH